jgi:hypothetical protein
LFGTLEGEPAVVTLQPQLPEPLCRLLAEHIDLEVRAHKLKKIGVLEMVQPLGDRKGLGVANLPAYCAEQIRLQLSKLGKGSYTVAEASDMQRAAKGVTLEAIGDPETMNRLGETGDVAAVVSGTLEPSGRNLVVQCKLVSTADCSKLGETSGVFALSEGLMADAKPWSWVHRDAPPDSPTSASVLQYIREQSQDGHPLLSEDFLFPVELLTVHAGVKEKITDQTLRTRKDWHKHDVKDPRTGETRTELLVGARDKETFEIKVTNKSETRVAMVLLVDGLNTIDQQRGRLETGRPWILEPKKEGVIKGWTFLGAGDNGEDVIQRFLFRNMAESVDGRKKFGDSIGLITIGFFAEAGRSANVKPRMVVDMREERELHRLKRVDFRVGRMIAAVNIRYVEERELEKLKAAQRKARP